MSSVVNLFSGGNMKHLHILPRFSDRWSHLYLEHGQLDKENDSLALHDKEGSTPIPVDQLCVVFLGPGTTISHAAVKLLADNNCQLYWVGEEGVRLYAYGIGGTHSAHRLLRQARLFGDEQERVRVVRRMYQKRFPNPIPPDATIEQIRGMEGARVRDAYRKIAETYNVEWHGPRLRSERLEPRRPAQPRALFGQRLPVRPVPRGDSVGGILAGHRLHPRRQDAELRL